MYYSRKIPPVRPGATVKTRRVFPYRLPVGLAENTPVIVEEVVGQQCAVRDPQDQVWTVPLVTLDPGTLFWENGQWVPEEGLGQRRA